jgi:hypothetical protein
MNIYLRSIFLTLCSVLNYLCVTAQDASVSVDNFTGSANIYVPLCKLKSGEVTMPISLYYYGGGVKVKETEGSAGIGWNLMAGGQISRVVKGIPDDQNWDNAHIARTGWLYNNNGNLVNSFLIANDNNPSTCTDGTSDLNFLNTNFSNYSDTEPDVFYVNVPGINCQMIFDKDHNFKTIPYKDIKVSYTTDNSNSALNFFGRITSFTITSDQGIKYWFNAIETTDRQASTSLSPPVAYFSREYEQYRNGINFVSAWKLTSITDLNNNVISISYLNGISRSANSRITLSTGSDTTRVIPFSIKVTSNQKIIDKIISDDYDGMVELHHELKFGYSTASTSSASVISSITGSVIKAVFNYTDALTKEPTSSRHKTFLSSVDINGLRKLSFDYYGLTPNPNSSGKIDLPDSLSKEIDQWGYYNGSGANSLLPAVYINPTNNNLERYRTQPAGINSASYPYLISGADRAVNASTIINGSLKSVVGYYGGTTTLSYEPNTYYDTTSGNVTTGGGIRVQQITTYDGVNTSNNAIQSYSYQNPSTGLSSGKALSVPLLAFTKVASAGGTQEDYWKNSTVRLEDNVSPESNLIVYTHVKLAQTGLGSTLFEYTAPATFWDSSASPDWSPTLVNVAAASCGSVGLISRSSNTYPFVQNPNFDFERGLLKKQTRYNDINEMLSESAYTYTRMAAPTVIQGLTYELLNGVATYAKYAVLAGTDNLQTQVALKEYDAPSTSQFQQSTTDNYYQSANHKLLTEQMATSSDGSIRRIYFKYVKDFAATSDATDGMNTALYNLKLANVNSLIESYSQVERSGVNKTISSSLVKYKPFSIAGTYKYLPSQKIGFISSDGLADFQVSTMAGNYFASDSRYQVLENYVLYGFKGELLTKDDNNKNVTTQLADYRSALPVAMFKNARADEVAYNNFETEGTFDQAFSYSYTKLDSTSSRTGKFGLKVTGGEAFSRTLSKSATAHNGIFSIWINSTSAGNLTLTLTNSSGTAYSFTIPYVNTAGIFKYFELKVPMVNMSTSFVAKYQSSTSIVVDDILFYPENAIASTIGYDPASYQKTAETNTNGVSKYYVYDKYRRPRYVLDQDKNILLKNSYINNSDATGFAATFTSTINPRGSACTFKAVLSSNEDGVVYTWNFGDGTPQVSSATAATVSHIYTTTGNFIVSLTKTSPFFGTVTSTASNTIIAPMVRITGSYPGGTIGSIGSVDFYKGTTLVQSFTGTQLTSEGIYQVPSDNYTIKVHVTDKAYGPTNPGGYKMVGYTGSSVGFSGCLDGQVGNSIYSFDVNLINEISLNIKVSDVACSPPILVE